MSKKDKRQSLYEIKLNDTECNFILFFLSAIARENKPKPSRIHVL